MNRPFLAAVGSANRGNQRPAEAKQSKESPIIEPTPVPRRAGKRRRTPHGRRGRPNKAQIASRDQELLDHALNLFLEKGFEGTTIEAISESIAMSPRTIYARYRDKDALFRAALQRAATEWSVPVAQLRSASCDDFEVYLLRIAHLLVASQTSASGLRLTRIANVEVFRNPDIGAYLWEQTALPVIEFLTGLFRERLLDRKLDTRLARDAAQSFMVLVVSGAFQSIAWNLLAGNALDKLVETRTRLFLAGARVIYGTDTGGAGTSES